MPRYDDEDDDRPRSRRRRDDDDYDDRPSRRSRRDEEDEDDRPRSRRRRDEDDEDDDRPRRRSRRQPEGNPAAATSLTLGLLSLLLNVLTGIPAIVFGVIGLKRAGDRGPGKGMALAGIGSAVVGMILSAVAIYFFWSGGSGFGGGNMSRRVQNNGKHLGLAMHNHQDAMGAFPAAYTVAPGLPIAGDGPIAADRRLTSWRTTILPYIEQDNLFRQYDPMQPYNGPRNLAVTAMVVRTLDTDDAGSNQTRWRVFTGLNTPFNHGQPGPRIGNFADGTSNTFLIVEGPEPGPWGEPRDLEVTPNGPLPAIGHPRRSTFFVVMADGSVRFVRKTLDERTLRNLIDPADGNVIGENF